MADIVHYEKSSRIARITLNRPEKRNALSPALVDRLLVALGQAGSDDDVRVVILSGEGSTFSAGADLDALAALQVASAEENLNDSEQLATLFSTIHSLPKPVIARINGHALAGGCGLASVCDISVASEEAELGFPEVRIGFVPAIVSVFLVRKVGEATLRDLLLRGARIPAAEAARIGLITRVVPAASLDETVEAMAEEIARETSPSTVMLTKGMLAAVRRMGFTEALSYATLMNAFARNTEDCRSGVGAFLE